MLHYIKFKNFQSFAREGEISLVVSGRSKGHKWIVQDASGERLSTVACVMGANGAGKTAALRPIAFVSAFIRDSFHFRPDEDIPGLQPHFDRPSTDPTEVEVQGVDNDGKPWRYRLVATRRMVLEEVLQHKTGRIFSTLFERRWDARSESYLIKQRGFGMPPREAAKVRKNASLISTAAQYGVDTAVYLTSRIHVVHNVEWFGRRHASIDRLEAAAKFMAGNAELRSKASELLSSWDLGLEEVTVQQIDVSDPATGATQKVWMPIGLHKKKSGEFHPLLMLQESSGTQAAFLILASILPVLQRGGLAVIDELDSDLHPHMIEPLLDLFASAVTNPLNAQLIFTCHLPDVLVSLQKTQLHLVEKTDCASSIYRADLIEGLRSDDNLRAKYMAGALGGVPRL